MKNVKLDVKENILTITVDLSKEHGRSKSGKTTIVATTEGNITIPDSNPVTTIGLNIYKK